MFFVPRSGDGVDGYPRVGKVIRFPGLHRLLLLCFAEEFVAFSEGCVPVLALGEVKRAQTSDVRRHLLFERIVFRRRVDAVFCGPQNGIVPEGLSVRALAEKLTQALGVFPQKYHVFYPVQVIVGFERIGTGLHEGLEV